MKLTKRLLRSHGTPSLLSRNALFTLKICPLCYHKTPFLHWFSSFFSSSFPPPPCYFVPPNGDRRPWMETSPSLPPRGGVPNSNLFHCFFLSKGCLQVGTDGASLPTWRVYLEERNMFIQGMLIMLFLSKDASLKQHVFILFRFRNRFLSLVFLCSSVFPDPLLWLKLQFPLCLFTLLFIYIYTSLFLNVSIYKYKNTFLFIYLCLSFLLF